jgi:hypothetical protein
MIKSIYENSLDHLLRVENHLVTASGEAHVFDVYPDPVKPPQDSLDRITNALAKMQLKSYRSHTIAELLDNLREVASIDDLPFQYSTPLVTERETGSGETVLADYDSDLESFLPERLVPVIIQQPKASQHDPNEALDQISAEMKMKLLSQLAGQEIDINTSAGFMQLNVLVFLRATSTTNSTTSQTRSSEHQSLR